MANSKSLIGKRVRLLRDIRGTYDPQVIYPAGMVGIVVRARSEKYDIRDTKIRPTPYGGDYFPILYEAPLYAFEVLGEPGDEQEGQVTTVIQEGSRKGGEMSYEILLRRIIDDGILAAEKDYARPGSQDKRDGSVAGFQACRDKQPHELRELLEAARTSTQDAYGNDDRSSYWWYRCYELEVEWVCNVVSAALQNQGLQVIVTPTARGAMKAAEILGIRK